VVFDLLSRSRERTKVRETRDSVPVFAKGYMAMTSRYARFPSSAFGIFSRAREKRLIEYRLSRMRERTKVRETRDGVRCSPKA
jgi:hypothetical protein